jgi:hypothetical protein
MGDGVKSIRKIEIDGMNLTLTADNRSHEVEKRSEICNCRFRFGEAMTVGITFNAMQNMMTNNEFRQLREIIEKRCASVVPHSCMIDSFKYGHNSSFLPYSREVLLS